jgi:hypothetical protein
MQYRQANIFQTTRVLSCGTCLDYLHSHTQTMRPSTAPSPIYLYTYFQRRVLGVASTPTSNGYWVCVAPSPLAPRPPHTATHTARNQGMSRLSTPAAIPERFAHPRPHRYTSALTSNGYWVCHPRPSLPDHTRQHTLLATQTSTVATTTCLGYLHSHT